MASDMEKIREFVEKLDSKISNINKSYDRMELNLINPVRNLGDENFGSLNFSTLKRESENPSQTSYPSPFQNPPPNIHNFTLPISLFEIPKQHSFVGYQPFPSNLCRQSEFVATSPNFWPTGGYTSSAYNSYTNVMPYAMCNSHQYYSNHLTRNPYSHGVKFGVDPYVYQYYNAYPNSYGGIEYYVGGSYQEEHHYNGTNSSSSPDYVGAGIHGGVADNSTLLPSTTGFSTGPFSYHEAGEVIHTKLGLVECEQSKEEQHFSFEHKVFNERPISEVVAPLDNSASLSDNRLEIKAMIQAGVSIVQARMEVDSPFDKIISTSKIG